MTRVIFILQVIFAHSTIEASLYTYGLHFTRVIFVSMQYETHTSPSGGIGIGEATANGRFGIKNAVGKATAVATGSCGGSTGIGDAGLEATAWLHVNVGKFYEFSGIPLIPHHRDPTPQGSGVWPSYGAKRW